ncbi:MAG: hypothetical protein IPJ06_19235 [Saprospiraceae bacterium]|nr:hypothetical protein [Saprospiraceae bacterium]
MIETTCGFGHSKLVNVIYLEFGACVLELPINVRIRIAGFQDGQDDVVLVI